MTAVAVTFTDSGDIVGRVAHGWLNGQRLNFASIAGTTGISTHTITPTPVPTPISAPIPLQF